MASRLLLTLAICASCAAFTATPTPTALGRSSSRSRSSLGMLGGMGATEGGLVLGEDRPKFEMGPASSRPDEMIFGASAAETASAMGDWCAYMQGRGVRRWFALLSPFEIMARSPDGTAEGYAAALSAAGLGEGTVVDASEPEAFEAGLAAANEAKAAREKLLVHCSDGHVATDLMMGAWLLRDYIGNDNMLEACDLLQASKRKTKVERNLSPEALGAFMGIEYEDTVAEFAPATGALGGLAPDGGPQEGGGGGGTRLESGLYVA